METEKTTDEMKAQYVDWVIGTLACDASSRDVPGLDHYLVNSNIRPCRADQPRDSRPQSGYLGENYPRYRVLVLGKNPGLSEKTVSSELENTKYYDTLQAIQDIPSLQKHTPTLRVMHNTWTPLKELNLLHHVGLQPSEIAYANQICQVLILV